MESNITIVHGNIFNSKAQTIVNTVNCVGYPNMFELYQKYCAQHLIEIGKLWIYKGDESDPWVLNFPTKTHWKLPSEYDYIEKGEILGDTLNNDLYLVYKKEGSTVNYEEYIKS